MSAPPSGSLRIGVLLDETTRERSSSPAVVPSHHLTTHGVIVGMTGSGKTGLGIVLLEEILSAGIPALILDPKGDMGNLALCFPDQKPDDFEPWVDAGEADREGIPRAELAARTAERWKKGLQGSGIETDDLRRYRDSMDIRILTPGSSAGVPVNVLGDLAAPDVSWEEHAETIREEIEGLVSGILVLGGLDADPLTSREHILLSNLVEWAWREGRDLDLATLIGQIQEPPLRRLGVFELDTFFPAKDRMALAMRLNGLVASPSFAEWLQGEPLDMDLLLGAGNGKTRANIVYLSHLSDAERQFVVTLLLSKVVTWMRKQPGTSELRALVYVDEVFGLAPPTAEPPSKRPMLTIFKQARAHGLGMVIATQNPVDLDYKIMSNAGTWMVGRLQTERDKARIIEALRSASGGVDVTEWDGRISELGKREFVLKTARSSEPSLFTSRWAMSFLRGPLTRAELGRLRPGPAADAEGRPSPGEPASGVDAPGEPSEAAVAAPSPVLADDESPVPPTIASGVRVAYLNPAAPWSGEVGVGREPGRLEAGVAVRVHLLFDESRADLRHEEEWEAVLFPLASQIRAADAVPVDFDDRDFRDTPPEGAVFTLPDVPVDRADFFRGLAADLKEDLYRARTLEVLRNAELKLYSRVGETEAAFRERCSRAAETEADGEAASLRDRYERRLDTARRRVDEAERRVRELEVDVGARRQQEVVAGAGELLSMFLGGRRRTRSLSGVASRRSQTRRTGERLQSAEEKLADYGEAVRELEEELTEELTELWEKWKRVAGDVEAIEVPLEKTDIRVEDPVLFWAPARG